MTDGFIIQDKQQLVRRLEQLATEAETSFALVFIPATPGEEDLPVLRDAVKLCDRVVVASEAGKLSAAVERLLREIGVDVVFLPATDTRLCKLDAGVKGVDATLMLQSIVLVFPNVVVVGKKDMKRLRVLKNLQQTFGEIVAVREVSTQ